MRLQTDMPQREQEQVLRASEVGTYAYCAHAWWLGAVEGVRPSNTRRLRDRKSVV